MLVEAKISPQNDRGFVIQYSFQKPCFFVHAIYKMGLCLADSKSGRYGFFRCMPPKNQSNRNGRSFLGFHQYQLSNREVWYTCKPKHYRVHQQLSGRLLWRLRRCCTSPAGAAFMFVLGFTLVHVSRRR